MGYLFQSSKVKVRDSGTRWVSVDVSNERIAEIVSKYLDIVLELKHSITNETEYVFISDCLNIIQNTNTTITQWLLLNGNETLPHREIDYKVVENTTVFVDLWDSILNNVKPARIGTHPDTDWPVDDCDDLILRFNGEETTLTYDDIYNKSLFTVNGLFHRASYSVNGIFLKDAAKSQRVCNRTSLGILSFEKIGNIEVVDLNTTQIINGTFDNHYDKVQFKTDVDLTNKSVLISIGGYLHVLDSLYSVKNPELGIVQINFNKYHKVKRYFDLKDTIDTDDLVLTRINDDKGTCVTDELMNGNAFIDSIIDMSQTFMVVVDGDCFKDKRELSYSNMNGLYYSENYVTSCVVNQTGKVMEHICKDDRGVYVVYVGDSRQPRYHFEKSDWLNNQVISDIKDPTTKNKVGVVSELIIGTSVLT